VAPADIQGSLERIDAEATVSRLLQVATAAVAEAMIAPVGLGARTGRV